MHYVELPELLNCYHRGAYSPVLIRLEGGNKKAGFCIEEYKHVPPLVGLYGDAAIARQILFRTLNDLPSYISGGVILPSVPDEWFLFEFRPSYRVSIYSGPHGVTVDRPPIGNEAKLRATVTEAHNRLLALYGRFYDV